MKKKFIYFILFLQTTNLTLTFDPFSFSLFAVLTNCFRSRQIKLNENKETPLYNASEKIEYKHLQEIIKDKLSKDEPFFCLQNETNEKNEVIRSAGQINLSTENIAKSSFLENETFLQELKKSQTGLDFYRNQTDPLHKNLHKKNPEFKNNWWNNKLTEIITGRNDSLTQPNPTKLQAAETEDAIIFKLKSPEDSLMNHEEKEQFRAIQTDELQKDSANFRNNAIYRYADVRKMYTLRKEKSFKVAERQPSDKVLTDIAPYRQFPILANFFTTPERYGYSTKKYDFQIDKI